MYSEIENQNNDSVEKRNNNIKVISIIFFLIIISVSISYVILKVYFPDTECNMDVDMWHYNDVSEVMEYMKEYDNFSYSLICDGSIGIDFVSYLENAQAHMKPLPIEGSDKYNAKIIMNEQAWDGLKVYEEVNNRPFDARAGLLVHEVCHATMLVIRGGFEGMDGCEMEKPCELRTMLFRYKSGSYEKESTYATLLKVKQATFLSRRADGLKCPPDGTGKTDYCTYASITVMNATEGKITVENTGNRQLHCMMLELSINETLFPVDCEYVPPGTSVTINNKYMTEDSDVTLRIFGCNNKITVNI